MSNFAALTYNVYSEINGKSQSTVSLPEYPWQLADKCFQLKIQCDRIQKEIQMLKNQFSNLLRWR